MNRLREAADGLVRLVTLAPERDPELAVTRELTDAGVVVAAGHCDPTRDELAAACDAGLTLFTHLGNGCPATLPRHDNVIWRALSLRDRLTFTVIADGVHLPFWMLRTIVDLAGVDGCAVVSDAVTAAGLGPGRFTLGAWELEVGEDLACRAPGGEHLVGSACPLSTTFERLQTACGFTRAEAVALTCDNPAAGVGRHGLNAVSPTRQRGGMTHTLGTGCLDRASRRLAGASGSREPCRVRRTFFTGRTRFSTVSSPVPHGICPPGRGKRVLKHFARIAGTGRDRRCERQFTGENGGDPRLPPPGPPPCLPPPIRRSMSPAPGSARGRRVAGRGRGPLRNSRNGPYSPCSACSPCSSAGACESGMSHCLGLRLGLAWEAASGVPGSRLSKSRGRCERTATRLRRGAVGATPKGANGAGTGPARFVRGAASLPHRAHGTLGCSRSPPADHAAIVTAAPADSAAPPRYVVGIDLGTTNSALAFVDAEAGDAVETWPVPQFVAAGTVESRENLPSFLYRPADGEFPPGSLDPPWGDGEPSGWVAGALARDHGARVPGRQIASSKSWLCHPGVDRTAGLLPWHAAEGLDRLSPVAASAALLAHLRRDVGRRPPRVPAGGAGRGPHAAGEFRRGRAGTHRQSRPRRRAAAGRTDRGAAGRLLRLARPAPGRLGGPRPAGDERAGLRHRRGDQRLHPHPRAAGVRAGATTRRSRSTGSRWGNT